MIDMDDSLKWKNWQGAAEHCGVPLAWLRNQTKIGNGPKYVQPSPKTILFRP